MKQIRIHILREYSCVSIDGRPITPRSGGKQDQILEHLLLLQGRYADRHDIMEALYADDPDPPFDSIVNVHMFKLRKRLEQLGMEDLIECNHTRGYRITPCDRFRLTLHLNCFPEGLPIRPEIRQTYLGLTRRPSDDEHIRL